MNRNHRPIVVNDRPTAQQVLSRSPGREITAVTVGRRERCEVVETRLVRVSHECLEPDNIGSICDGHIWKREREKNNNNDRSVVIIDVIPNTHASLPTPPSESNHMFLLRRNSFPVRATIGHGGVSFYLTFPAVVNRLSDTECGPKSGLGFNRLFTAGSSHLRDGSSAYKRSSAYERPNGSDGELSAECPSLEKPNTNRVVIWLGGVFVLVAFSTYRSISFCFTIAPSTISEEVS